MLYYIIFSLLAGLGLLEMVIVPPRTKKMIYVGVFILFILLSSMRWNTGNDWRPYYKFFTTFTTDNPWLLLTFEPGFTQFVKFLRLFSDNFTFYLTVLSVLTIGIKGIFFYRYTSAIFLAALLYWGTNMSDLAAVRQTLAISLCMASTIFIVEKKPLYFLLFLYLATQFHITSVVFIAAYPIFHAKWSVKSKYAILIFTMILGGIGTSQYLLEFAVEYMPAGFGLDRISAKAQAYFEMGNEVEYSRTVSKSQRLIAAVAKRAILLPLFIFFQNRLENVDKNYLGFLNLYTFGNILYFVVIDFQTLQRTASYFYIFEILLFCIIFTHTKSKGVWLVIIILYSLFKLISLLLSAYDLLVPYIWIFQGDTYRFLY